MNADEVLDCLSAFQEALGFLASDGRQHIADARLSVFRSDEHFAVFTEFANFFYGFDEFCNVLGWAGNCLVEEVQQAQFDGVNLVEEVPDAPLWREDEYVHWLGDRANFSVQVKEQRHDFRPSPEDYERAGIRFEEEKSGPNSITPGQLLRFVSVALDHPSFLPEEELRSLILPETEPQMSLFVQTNWWQHPEYLVFGDGLHDPLFADSAIFNISCWQILSRAIASGDLHEWNAQDTSKFNTDWTSLERIYRKNNDGYGFS